MTSPANERNARHSIDAEATDSTTRIRLHGEIDALTVEGFDAALSGLTVDGRPNVCIDVTDLEFIDVGGLRRLTNFAEGLGQDGRHVTTVGASPLFRLIAQFLPNHDHLGLV